MWSEIKRLVPVKIVTCILPVTFLRMITILPILATKWTSNFKILMTLFSGKAQKVFIVFVSRRCLMKILKHIWDLYLINPKMIYWVWTSIYWESAPYISIPLANVINKPLKSGVFEQDWENARVTPIYKDDGDIDDENNYRPISVIGHIAKMNPLWVVKLLIFWKNIVLFQWINLLIWKDTAPKLAFTML